MKRLFLFTNSYPLGSGEEFLETEILYLSDFFDEICIFPLVKSFSANKRRTPDNVICAKPMIGCGLDNKIKLFLLGFFNAAPIRFAIKEFIGKKVFRRKKWLLTWLSFTCIIRAALAAESFKHAGSLVSESDILYFYWADNSACLLPFLRKTCKNFSVVRFHGGDLYEERKGNLLPYRQFLFQHIDLGVFISEHGKNYFDNRYPGHLKNKIVSRLGVKDNGLSLLRFTKKLHIVSCSALVAVKRVKLIALALQYIDFDVHWTHFGHGPLMKEVKESIVGLPSNITVSLKGHVSNHQVIAFYREHPVDLFINVSESEGIPVSIMEAVSMGIPVLATNVGGVSEIVDSQNGYLIPHDSSIEEIAGYLKTFYHSADKNRLRENSRKKWKEKFDADTNYILFSKTLTTKGEKTT